MNVLIAGGTGFIGQHLVKHRLSKGDQVVVLGRSTAKIEKVFGSQVKSISWENLNDFSDDVDVVINLAGFNIGQSRWTEKVKERIISSRVETAKQLVQWCLAKSKPPRLLTASAVGIYGSFTDASLVFNETSHILDCPGCFSQEVVRLWEEAVDHDELSTTIMRFGVVLKRGHGALKKLALPFYFGLGAVMGSGQQPFAWVALEDVLGAIDHILAKSSVSGVINITGPETITNVKLCQLLSKTLKRPLIFRIPGRILKFILGQMGEELILSGQVVIPSRLIELDYHFKYSSLSQWFKESW